MYENRRWYCQNKYLLNRKCNTSSIRIIIELTSLSFMANMIALACSAAFPTIGSRMTLIKDTGMFNESDAP